MVAPIPSKPGFFWGLADWKLTTAQYKDALGELAP